MPYRTTAKRAVLAKRLKDSREQARLSSAQLAEMLGVSRATVQMWEAGHRVPRDPFKVADALGVDPYWLAGRKAPVIKKAATNGTGPK